MAGWPSSGLLLVLTTACGITCGFKNFPKSTSIFQYIFLNEVNTGANILCLKLDKMQPHSWFLVFLDLIYRTL